MKGILVIICTLLFAGNILAQRPEQKEVAISGKVIDRDTKAPLEYATIAFFSKRQNKIITGGITDARGNFNIKVPSGQYDISVEYIAFITETIPGKRITTDTNLGTISLGLDVESLDEVEVIAERTTVEIKLDKKIYNVGKDLTVRGGTVSDVLDNVPSVSVDVEGNVALRGNDNVRILINGKPSGLVGLNSTDALRQLPAESIEKVEVITSPSARYDAEGTAGILNIILRRSKLQGLNGAITLNTGYPYSAGFSGNVNYRTGDVNIFSTSGIRYREVPGQFSSFTLYNDGFTLDEKTIFDRFRRNLNTNIGIEWYINKSSSVTTSFLYRLDNHLSTSTNTTIGTAIGEDPVNTVRIEPENEDGSLKQFSLNYTKDFETSGHKLTFDFQYEDEDEDEISDILVNGINEEKVGNLEGQRQILVQTDYVLPIGENQQLELGYRGNFNERTTDYRVDTLDVDTGLFVVDQNLTNLFNYSEDINALYSQYGSKIGKFSYLLGLRMENTRITLDQPTTGEYKLNKYTGLFPTVNLNYELSESENLTLAYNRRIRRPRSFFINPFPSRRSVTSVFQGNPDLNPSYSGQLDAGYLKRFGKFTFDTSLYYSHATDVYNFVLFDTGELVEVNGQLVPVIQRTPINLATEDRTGFEFTLAYRASKKWNINTNFNFFNRRTEGIAPDGTDLGNETTSWFLRLNNKLTLPGNIEWQTRLMYRGPQDENSQSSRNGVFVANVALSKDLFKEKASIAFNTSDLFNSRKREQTFTTATFTSDNEFQWRERSFNLSFTYRFNQKKKRSRGPRGDGDGDFEFQGRP